MIDSLLLKLMILNKTIGRTLFLDVGSLGDVNKAVDGRSLWRKDRTHTFLTNSILRGTILMEEGEKLG